MLVILFVVEKSYGRDKDNGRGELASVEVIHTKTKNLKSALEKESVITNYLYIRVTTGIHDFINQLQGRRNPVCTHTMYGETEEELLKNAKEHGIKEHGYTEESWNEKMSKDQEKLKTLIKSS